MPEPGPDFVRRAADRDALFVEARRLVAEHSDRFRRVGTRLDRLTEEAMLKRDAEQEADEPRVREWFVKRYGCEPTKVPRQDVPDRLVERCGILGAALVNPDHALARYFDFAGRAPKEERLDAAAAFLLAVLVVGDPDLHEHVGREVTIFATLPWYGQDSEGSNLAMGRCFADRFRSESGDWEPSDELLERIRFAASLFRPGNEAEPTVSASGTDQSTATTSGAVSKPDGWTRGELIAQAEEFEAQCSASTFDNIRKAAEIQPAERGGAGAQRRFSVAELHKLIAAAENGNYRSGKQIAEAWRALLQHS